MTGIEPVRVSLPDLRAIRVKPEDLASYEEDPYRLTESPEEAAARAARAGEARTRLWSQRRPSRFAEASLDDLTDEQDPDRKIRRWWDSTSLTLILQAEQPGVGKTHAGYAVGNHVVAGGAWAAAWSMVDLNDALRPGSDSTAYWAAQECDLLLLDDVGREQVSPWTLERLQGVLDHRWREQRRTVVTTNLTGAEFLVRYGDPIVDRLTDAMTMVTLRGQSRRRPAPW